MAVSQCSPGGRFIHKEDLLAFFWSTIWVLYLVVPAVIIWTAEPGSALGTKALMSVLLVSFVLCYLTYWWLCITGHLRAWATYGGAVFLLVFAVVVSSLGTQFYLGYTLVYAASAIAFALVPRFRTAVLAVFGIALLAVAIGVIGRLDPWSTAVQAMVVLSGGAGVLGYAAMKTQNDKLRAAREEIARLAVAEERLRFSRDLHDLLGHSLSVIVLKAELAHRMADRSPERTVRELADIEKVARDALHEVREAVAGYRQPSLSQELDSAAETLRAAGVQVQVAGGPGTLPGPLDGALAWTVREATTNVIRHARARRVRFEFSREDQTVRLRVANDGVPAAAPTPGDGNGLRGLRERLRALGGELNYGPGKTDGFTLNASLPLAAEAAMAPAALA